MNDISMNLDNPELESVADYDDNSDDDNDSEIYYLHGRINDLHDDIVAMKTQISRGFKYCLFFMIFGILN